jgi:hypothetical protein
MAKHAQPLHLFALHIHPMLRISAAFGAEFLDRDFILVELFLAILLLNLPLDGQAMAIPAGHIGRVFAEQALRAADHVFQDMVQRMADMHIAIGIRRAIMQDELLPPRAGFAQAVIQAVGFPLREDARLLLREPGLHGEISLRQEDGVAVIHGFFGWSFGHVASALRRARASSQSRAICSFSASRLSNFASPRRKEWKATSMVWP